jgi:hypothetical protein
MSIPRRIIQTAKTRELSPLARAGQTNIKLLHPEWEHLFFDDDDIRAFVANEFPKYLPAFNSFRRPIQRIDFFRYLAVFRHGGFYFDLDVFLFASIAPLLANTCVFPFEELSLSRFLRQRHGIDWELGNYAFGAAPGNPFLEAVIENCVRAQRDPTWNRSMLDGIPKILRRDFEVLYTTGPGLVTRTLAENSNLAETVKVLFPADVCDAKNWDLFGDYGAHLMDGSWRSNGGNFLRRRIAGWAEARLLAKLLPESRRLGPTRAALPATDRRTSPENVGA